MSSVLHFNGLTITVLIALMQPMQFPSEGRRFPCSAALLDVMRDYLMVALLKGFNRNPVVPLLDCIRLSALVLIMLLLLQCGDVERNPGPVERGRWLCLTDRWFA